MLSHRYWTSDVHSLQSTHVVFLLYVVMQHTTISFSCQCLTLWQWHLVSANIQITQPWNSQLYFENQWRHYQYLQVILLILKDLHSFSPIFVPVLLWQCLSQACLFVVFWLTKLAKVSKLFQVFCAGDQWQLKTVFLVGIFLNE